MTLEQPAFLHEAAHAITRDEELRPMSRQEISAALLAAHDLDRALLEEKSRYRDPLDKEVLNEVGQALENKGDMLRLKNRIASESPRLQSCLDHIKIEQRAAKSLRSSLEPLPKEIKNTKIGRGIMSSAAAVEISRRSRYTTYYPDPVLDALYKIDFVAASQNEQTVFLVQVKTIPKLHEMHVATAHEFLKKFGALALTTEWEKIKKDLIVLQRFSGILEQRYGETFIPILFSVPALGSPKYAATFDKSTGLPRREIGGIILPQR